MMGRKHIILCRASELTQTVEKYDRSGNRFCVKSQSKYNILRLTGFVDFQEIEKVQTSLELR